MFVTSSPRRLAWFAALLEPLGLRWEAEAWFSTATRSPGLRNAPLPPDGWALVHRLANGVVHTPEGYRQKAVTHLQLKAFMELSVALGERFRHPAISGIAFSVTDRRGMLPHVHAWRLPDTFNVRPFGGGISTVMGLRDVYVNGVGQCFHYMPMTENYVESFPWTPFDPANPWVQQLWVDAYNEHVDTVGP